jgi:hypothetical protein
MTLELTKNQITFKLNKKWTSKDLKYFFPIKIENTKIDPRVSGLAPKRRHI